MVEDPINAVARGLSKAAGENGMRGRRQEKSGVIEVGERSVRNFFFEHPMATYAAALAYRGLFGLFPFVLILVVLVGALGIPDFFDRAGPGSRPIIPVRSPATRTGGRAGSGTGPTAAGDDRAGREAGGSELLLFGVAVALWSVSAVARTLTEAFNVAYQVAETRRWWKRLALSLAFGPVLALVVIVSVALMLIGPQLVGSIAERWVSTSCSSACGGGCAFP